MARDPHIARRHAVAAGTFQFLFPTLQRLFLRPSELEFATQEIAPPVRVMVPTRHGAIGALVHSPTVADRAAQAARGERSPVHLLTHGGAFITRYPQEEGNVARYLASEVGCYVVIPDYFAAPQVRHPVAEEQCYDTLNWIRDNADAYDWDAKRISVGGPSAGGHLALCVALMAIDAGGYVPVAVTSEYGVADMSRGDEQRTSTKPRPMVGPPLMRLVRNTYFKDVDVNSAQASPFLHPSLGKLPPTLVLTAEFDTLRDESNELADKLRTLGVQVTHHEFPGIDHGFTHMKPVESARTAITMIGDHLASAYTTALEAAQDS